MTSTSEAIVCNHSLLLDSLVSLHLFSYHSRKANIAHCAILKQKANTATIERNSKADISRRYDSEGHMYRCTKPVIAYRTHKGSPRIESIQKR